MVLKIQYSGVVIKERYGDFAPVEPPAPRLHCPLESMQESDKLRRSKLIREVTKQRDLLSMLKITDRRAPSSEQEAIARRNREITDKLRALENELHALNVQLIREGLSDNPS